LFSSDLTNLGCCDSFIVTVVPFSDVVRDLHLGFTLKASTIRSTVRCPRKRAVQPEVEKFKCTLGAFSW
jgi:hypothetical protein